MLVRAPGRFAVPAVTIEAVDTLGAGDTFIARTLFGLLRGEERRGDLVDSRSAPPPRPAGYYGAVGHAG